MSTLASVILINVFASRPAASIPGRLFFASDTLVLYRDNGTTWDAYSATGGGSGTVTTTGTPASGNLSKFSGATSITNADLTGDVTTSGATATTAVKIPPGVTLTGTPSAGMVPTATGGTAATWQTPSGAMTKLAETILVSNLPTVSFSGISGIYRNLILTYTARTDSAAVNIYIQFNGDTGANYTSAANYNVGGGGFTSGLSLATIAACCPSTAPSNQAGSGTITVYSYSLTTFNKTATGIVNRVDSSSAGFAMVFEASWGNTAAITSIVLGLLTSGNFVAGSIFTLYGQS